MDTIVISVHADSLSSIRRMCIKSDIDYETEYEGRIMSVIRIYNVSSMEIDMDSEFPELVIYTDRDSKTVTVPLNLIQDYRLF